MLTFSPRQAERINVTAGVSATMIAVNVKLRGDFDSTAVILERQ